MPEQSDPRMHAQKIAGMLNDLTVHLRKDIDKVDEPQAKALFEAASEVLLGLRNAFEHYRKHSEPAWQG